MKTEYSISGMDETGRHVTDPLFGDMDIRADGFFTEAAARVGANTLFGQSDKVAYVTVRESIQETEGGSWREGRVVGTVHRKPRVVPIPDPEVEW